MTSRWQEVQSRFESFKIRERLLLMGAFLGLIYMLWEFLLMQPLTRQQQVLEAREDAAAQAVQSSEAEYMVLSGLAERDPHAALRRELHTLNTQLQKVDRELAEFAGRLIDAKELPRVMHHMLQQAYPVNLLQVATLPKERVRVEPKASEADGKAEAANPNTLGLYRHGVRLEFEGSFHLVYDLLHNLERSEWQFYWDALDYQVENFPQAKVVLNVFTLSTDQQVVHE